MEMPHRNNVSWRQLCEQASRELDPHRLIELVQQLNELLEVTRLTNDPHARLRQKAA